MRKFLQYLLRRPILWLSEKFASRPDKEKIYDALTRLHAHIIDDPGKKGCIVPFEDFDGRFIIFSDQHKGNRNGADDFVAAETSYLAALQYYNNEGFCFINLGDCEELWENLFWQVKKAYQTCFELEGRFLSRNAFIKIFGNHDLYWANDPLASFELENIYKKKVKIYEGVILTTEVEGAPLQIFCTHGHQGDANSDGNWFTKFFIARIWAPLQSYLHINPNEPSNNIFKKTLHNEIMYEWSASQKNMLLVTGHTHQPVFESLTHIERLRRQMKMAETNKDVTLIAKINDEVKTYQKRFDTITEDFSQVKPSYFNTGCCCFSDGDITGIEIEGGFIRLVKWQSKTDKASRIVLEEKRLADLV
ncbi:metallophosphoesterase [Niabella insulamsoli]|uniref:metallophosphoesterase n=1 Tax=Niabella insulamsoli TaxID=3144874 RepID=UPI0031FDAAEE